MARHTYRCAPRWGDVDKFGHLNNVRFFDYLEQARVDLFFDAATRQGVAGFAAGAVVARHEIDYLRPVEYHHEPLRIDMWCDQISGASFTVRYEIFDEHGDGAGVLAVRASSLLVPYDLAAARPRRLSGVEREFLCRYLEQGAA